MPESSNLPMPAPPSVSGGEKKHWWFTNRKMAERYVREARTIVATQDPNEIAAALGILEAALALAPRMEAAIELKARCLLYLRRFKEVADLLQDYIPSLKMVVSDDTSSFSGDSLSQVSRERVRLLPDSVSEDEPVFVKCFSVSDLKKKVIAGLCKTDDKQGHWRYMVLGQACCHLGLMEDAMVLLQTGKRLATAALRRESNSRSDDIVSFNKLLSNNFTNNQSSQASLKTESDYISNLISHIKQLLRRKTAAIAAVEAGLYSEAVRHFSKILGSRRGAPQAFLAECYVHRAGAYKSSGRIADALADCNKALALDTSCIGALTIRAALFESVRCLPDSLHDLEHLKLLYNSILRDRKLPGPVWKRQNVPYDEIPGKLCSLSSKIQQLKQRVAAGETGNVDYYVLFGLGRGCMRSELERAHVVLTLRHKPDKSSAFIERCEFADEKEVDLVRDRARASALFLYRLIQRGYSSLMGMILDEVAVEKERKKVAAAIRVESISVAIKEAVSCNRQTGNAPITTPPASAFQGVFCRDLTVVGNLLSQARFSNPVSMNYEALSC